MKELAVMPCTAWPPVVTTVTPVANAPHARRIASRSTAAGNGRWPDGGDGWGTAGADGRSITGGDVTSTFISGLPRHRTGTVCGM
ncbi:hypothetical protein GCM10017559_76140 [Streptosporangium longisporum]|uniref:Uncharacterized protein n=1 Tax=Streptosporangium longisporum TaxID=46187 RepID=A0ABP6LEA2_9ACTN